MVTYTDGAKSTEESTRTTKPRSVIKLPALFPWRFYNASRIRELAERAQKNYADPTYDHTSKKWLSEEEEAELGQLLGEGFDHWDSREYRDFVQGCVDFGPTDYKQIAEVIGTKTEEEVREYSTVFWAKGAYDNK